MRVTPSLTPYLLLLVAPLFIWALATGSVHIPFSEVLAVLWGKGDPHLSTLILQLRLPRALAAFAAGGLLALSGSLMQVLLRNPLADPYVLGVSGGAATASLALMLLGMSGTWILLGAFLGALFSTLMVFALAYGRGFSTARLLLTGVVTAAGWGAAINFMLTLSPDATLKGMVFWLMGDLSAAEGAEWALLLLLLGVILLRPLSRPLDLLARGEERAAGLGVSVGQLHVTLYLAASLFTAVSVTIAGSVGFVGLVAPHMVRLAQGGSHRHLLPAATLAGGLLLLGADTVARTLLAPQQLPVGVVTAAMGVPLFLFLLRKGAA